MKISDTKVTPNEFPTGRRSGGQTGQTKGFSKVLERKKASSEKNERSEKETDELKTGKKKDSEIGDAMDLMRNLQAPPQPTSSTIQSVEASRGVAASSPFQSLVQEILVGINASGQDEVQIQMNSNTFEGLRIHITKEAGELSIRFISRSDEVAQLLTKNMDSLSQALAAHSLNVGQIQVQRTAEPSRFEERGRQSGDQRQGDQGQGDQGRQGRRR